MNLQFELTVHVSAYFIRTLTVPPTVFFSLCLSMLDSFDRCLNSWIRMFVDDSGNKEQNTLTVYLSALRKHSMK